MKATLEMDVDDPQAVMDSISPDEQPSDRIRIEPRAEGGKLIVEIEASDFSALRAGVTSYMRLAKAALVALGEE